MSVSPGGRFLSLLFGCGLLLAFAPAAARSAPSRQSGGPAVTAPRDSFPHKRHLRIRCLNCHVVKNHTRQLAYERPLGCDLCHHQEAMQGRYEVAQCARCHAKILQPPASPVIPAGGAPARRQFRHERHAAKPCASCHVAPRLAPSPETRTCVSCHADHHTARRDCVECHRSPGLADAHARETHRGCDECHDKAIVATLVPDRGLCLTCHEPKRDHQAGRECTSCHFLATPAEYQRYLLVGGSS